MTHIPYPITIEKEGKRYYAYSDGLPGIYWPRNFHLAKLRPAFPTPSESIQPGAKKRAAQSQNFRSSINGPLQIVAEYVKILPWRNSGHHNLT
jgi:hypothetical protein